MNKIGPTFPSELVAAGVPIDGLSWDILDGTILASDGPDHLAAAEAVLKTHDPTKTLAPEVPTIISDRQFFQALAMQTVITQDEAFAAVTSGTMPAKVADLISKLPQAHQFPAKMEIMGANLFDRTTDLAKTLSALFGMDAAGVEALWALGASL